MQGKNFLFFGLISVVIIVGMTYLALNRTPPVVSQPEEQFEEFSRSPTEESLVESLGEEPMKEESLNIKQYSAAPEMQLKDEADYKALIKTSKGEVLVDLFEKESPITVNNFVFLAKEGFYDGVIFHRVIKEFMIQGGDPLGVGVGDAGYKFGDEFNDKKLVAGSLAMANSGPDTNGSQFFIVTGKETPWLDGFHTNFGQVVEGMDVVSAIEDVETSPGNNKPLEDVTINSIEIIEE